MKKDLNNLMKKMKIDALYAEGKSSSNPTMYYLLNGANIHGMYIKKRGKRAWVIHSPIEREVAAQTGHKLISVNHFEPQKIFSRQQDRMKANAMYLNAVLTDLNVKGRVAFYGCTSFGAGYNILRKLLQMNRHIKLHYDAGKDILTAARETKDYDEIKRIKQVGRAVAAAFRDTLKTVQAMKVKKGIIMKDRRRKLLIGDLRALLHRSMFERGIVSTEGMIVAQGRDAGVPHNAGRDREAVALGKTIVFDIFPRERGGGYFFDFTRTICFGHAPEHIKKVYKLVADAQDYAFSLFRSGTRCNKIGKAVCEFFEKAGHTTLLSDSKTQTGYCHSLGHGLGLDIHESPSFSLYGTNKDTLRPGHVFTNEPGLYYPQKGFGVRLEDVVFINKKGKPVNLTRSARKLVIEM
ncbi:MAG: aminopeptidase P family protein [candidate division WOR-3 bacterium]|nr:MAG: aminopeptidase P family protein [candidate division WOR-3 bacterium]